MQFPTISVVIATHNAQNTIEKCLTSLRNQHYPQKNIEIIVADGASTDNTLHIVKKYADTIIPVPKAKQNAEYNKGIGVRKARNELVLMIDHDNVLPHKKWLSSMVRPLLEHKEIVGVETLRYHYNPTFSLLDRYFALFGAGDPLAFYLGKSDRLAFIHDTYNLYGKAKDLGAYYVVEFDPQHIPALGANGFLVRREVLFANARIDKDHFFHIDVNVDLIRKGFNTYAFIKDDIIHLTGYKSITSFLYRRKLFMEQFHFQTHGKRRYGLYTAQDKWKLLVFILFAITFVKPTYDAARGYVKIRDIAWFLHPFLCFALLVIYAYTTIKMQIKK